MICVCILCFLQLMVDGVTGEVMVLVQQRAAMAPVRGRVPILHILLVGGHVKEQMKTHNYANLIHIQVCMNAT